jgi:hypothetical protein
MYDAILLSEDENVTQIERMIDVGFWGWTLESLMRRSSSEHVMSLGKG